MPRQHTLTLSFSPKLEEEMSRIHTLVNKHAVQDGRPQITFADLVTEMIDDVSELWLEDLEEREKTT